MIAAVVPVKRFAAAKQRLAAVLAPAERASLARAMLADVLAALVAAPGLERILVVTADPDAAALARRFGAEISAEDSETGQSAAVAAAARRLARDGVALLTVPADIPAVEPRDIAAVIAAGGAARCYVIAAARDGRGSNAILCAPADAVPFRFGPDSFAAHCAAARAAGFAVRPLDLPRVALDIDAPEDLALLVRLLPGAATRAWLAATGAILAEAAR